MNFREKLAAPGFIILDGAMGTQLQKRGMPVGAVPETMNLLHPEWLLDIYQGYLRAGSDVIFANTFGASEYKTAGCGFEVEELIGAGVRLAKQAAAEVKPEAFVAMDMGSIGQLLESAGSLTFDQAYEMFARQVRAGAEAGADLVVIETMTDLLETKAALLAVKENSSLPVICSMTFEKNGRTFTGCSVPSMALTLEGLGADVLGVNCSLGPTELVPLLDELRRWTSLPLMAKPNAGLPDPGSNVYSVEPGEFGSAMGELARLGVQCLGGCCGTGPDYIAAIRENLRGLSCQRKLFPARAAVCSPAKAVEINRVRVIGERINPTGKKRFQQALRDSDLDYVLAQGLEQCRAGAEILDVNVGVPGLDEKALMLRVVKGLQGVLDAPLQLDSSEPEVLEAAMRVYAGKPVVNSVNGKAHVLESLLPLVKKYGAAVVGLTLDERGILKSAEERFAIAEKIVNAALAHGIRREDIYIDCLTLTASAEQDSAMETVRAVRMVKERLSVKTVLGVSNISFGLPNRELVNQNFLTLAMGAGLDLPIMNPNIVSMMGAVRAYSLLSCADRNAIEFVAAYADTPAVPFSAPVNMELGYAVENGLKEDAARITAALLETTAPLDVVDGQLIPTLDRAGTAFERGKIFLPQLIQCAGAAQAAFEVIRERLARTDGAPVSKGKIVVATVQGDIHDIGKNIVKTLLVNYGYTVIDLGKDVPPQTVADAVRTHGAKLVGLSALMTTTLKGMADTISLLHEEGLPCKIVVGGAVLTPEYALKIGADFYAKDAKETVDIAKKLFQ